MKLSLKIDLEPLRTQVLAQIDRDHEAKAAGTLSTLHASKLVVARQFLAGQTEHPCLTHEALLKGVSVRTLCQQIVAKDTEASKLVLQLEADRQALKAKVKTMLSEQDLRKAFHPLNPT